MGSNTLIACLTVGAALLLYLGLMKRSWVGYTVMPRRGAVITAAASARNLVATAGSAPSTTAPQCVDLPWPAIVRRDEGEWLVVGEARIRATDVIRSDQALGHYTAWIAREPENAEARVLRGILLGYMSKPAQALANCVEASRLDPELPMAHYLLGNLERETGDAAAALVHFDEAVRLRPDFADALAGRGAALWAEGDAEQALDDFDRALELAPDNLAARFGRGLVHCGCEDFQAGIEDFDEVIRLNPNRAEAYFSRAGARAALGNLDGALADLDAYVRFNPQNSAAFGARGNLRRALGQLDPALDDFTKAIRLYSGDPQMFCSRGTAWSELGEYQRALDDFAEAITLDPECAQAFNNQAWLLATCPAPEFRDGPAAVEAAREACRLSDYQDARCIDTLAAACAAAGDFIAAGNWQRDVIDRLEADPAAQQSARARLLLYERSEAYRDA